MTQTVSCIYEAREDADAAAAELRKIGFPDHDIHLVALEDRSDEAVGEAVRQAGLRAMHAECYAEAIKRGGTLVSVPAQFGCAGLVNLILQKHNPIQTGLPEQGYEQRPRDPAAPLSSAWGWTVLIDDPAPLSKLLVSGCCRPTRPCVDAFAVSSKTRRHSPKRSTRLSSSSGRKSCSRGSAGACCGAIPPRSRRGSVGRSWQRSRSRAAWALSVYPKTLRRFHRCSP